MGLGKTVNIRWLYLLHFLLFFFIHVKQPLEGDIPKLIILGTYIFLLLIIVSTRIVSWNKVALGLGAILLALSFSKLILVLHFNFPFFYLFFTFATLSLFHIDKSDITFLIRSTGILYFTMALLLHYTPLRIFSVYELRELDNKFFGGLNRFLGITGSPAGPDIVYCLILIYTIACIESKKLIDYINIFISILILLWTSSISPIFSVFLALPIFFIKKLRVYYFLACIYYCFVLVWIFNRSSDEVRTVLNVLTTLRVEIWNKILDGLNRENSVIEWLLGRKETVMFTHLFNTVDGNPHNLLMLLLEFTGISGVFFFTIYLIHKVYKITNGFVLFLLFILAFYSTTSPIPWTIVDCPLIMYMSYMVLNRGYLFIKSNNDSHKL